MQSAGAYDRCAPAFYFTARGSVMIEGVLRRIQQYAQILFRVAVAPEQVLLEAVGSVRGDRVVYVLAAVDTDAVAARQLNLVLGKALVEAGFEPYVANNVSRAKRVSRFCLSVCVCARPPRVSLSVAHSFAAARRVQVQVLARPRAAHCAGVASRLQKVIELEQTDQPSERCMSASTTSSSSSRTGFVCEERYFWHDTQTYCGSEFGAAGGLSCVSVVVSLTVAAQRCNAATLQRYNAATQPASRANSVCSTSRCGTTRTPTPSGAWRT